MGRGLVILVAFLAAAVFSLGLFGASGQVTVLTPTGDDNVITQNTTIFSGASPYTINDANGNGVLIVNTSGVTLDCNGSVLQGTGAYGIFVNASNVVVRNCTLSGYDNTIFINKSNSVTVRNSNLTAAASAITTSECRSILLDNNTLFGWVGISFSNTNDTLITKTSSLGALFTLFLNSAYNNVVMQSSFVGGPIWEFESNLTLDVSVSYSMLVKGWALMVNTTNSTGAPVSGVTVDVESTLDPLNKQSGSTGPNGTVSFAVSEYMVNNTGVYQYNPYRINATKAGYERNTTQVKINKSSKVSFVMTAVTGPPPSPPNITYSISPKTVLPDQQVSIFVNATDDTGVDAVWADITLPAGGGTDRLVLKNRNTTAYSSSLPGTHAVRIYANDTAGSTISVSDNFTVSEIIYLNSTVHDRNMSGISSNLSVYEAGTDTLVSEWHSDSGRFTSRPVLAGVYDLLFEAYGNRLQVRLKNVNVSVNRDKPMGMDNSSTAAGIPWLYGVKNGYSAGQAEITVWYDKDDYTNASYLQAYICTDWNFTGGNCGEDWEIDDGENDVQGGYFTFTDPSLEALGIGVVQATSYCGDGVCGTGEDSTDCPEDCVCDTGDTRTCGVTDVGPCSFGTQECDDGAWGVCVGGVLPSPETCNGIDDNCDGVVDNLNNGTSIETSGCGCYGGSSPTGETCNGIDDDCDGETDEGLQKTCGTSVGRCELGTAVCAGGVWVNCTGGVGPVDEVCGNGLDDDCDGETDEFCASCTNSIQDGDETGVDCGGSCPYECAGGGWELYVLGGGIVLFVCIIYIFFMRKKRGPSWEELERKYSGRPAYRAPQREEYYRRRRY